MATPLVCTPRRLTDQQHLDAAHVALQMNPTNRPHAMLMARALAGGPSHPLRIAVLTGKRWPASGVRLTVSFLDNPAPELRRRILLHMNAWAKTANVKFTETQKGGQVRIARMASPPEMSGYWSYVGTEILTIPKNEPTMNLESFSTNTPEREFIRVVRHETGHTLGFPHEHMRRELVDLIDREKAIALFMATQGWSRDEVIAQVLTPIEESSLLGTAKADPKSIMCYQIPGDITRNGKPILGGVDIDPSDFAFAGSIYPKAVTPKTTTRMRIPRRREGATPGIA
jgi:hypothetical protein